MTCQLKYQADTLLDNYSHIFFSNHYNCNNQPEQAGSLGTYTGEGPPTQSQNTVAPIEITIVGVVSEKIPDKFPVTVALFCFMLTAFE